MKKMLIGVFVFIFSVIGFSIFLIVLYTPVQTPTAFDEQGLMLHEDGRTEQSSVRLAGTMVTYRLNVDSPYFTSNSLSTSQGLLVDNTRYISKLVFGWPDKEDDYVSFVFNGIRFFTDRDLDFVIAIIPDGTDADRVAVAPASDVAEAKALIQSVVENQDMKFLCPSACSYLLTYLE